MTSQEKVYKLTSSNIVFNSIGIVLFFAVGLACLNNENSYAFLAAIAAFVICIFEIIKIIWTFRLKNIHHVLSNSAAKLVVETIFEKRNISSDVYNLLRIQKTDGLNLSKYEAAGFLGSTRYYLVFYEDSCIKICCYSVTVHKIGYSDLSSQIHLMTLIRDINRAVRA